MRLSLLLIVIGIVLAILVNYALGIVCILVGLVLLVWPRISSRGAAGSSAEPNCISRAQPHSLAFEIVISEGWQSG